MSKNKKISSRRLVLFSHKDWGDQEENRYMTYLYANENEETLYAEYMDGDGDYTTLEMGVHVDDLIKIRDWLNERIYKIMGGEKIDE